MPTANASRTPIVADHAVALGHRDLDIVGGPGGHRRQIRIEGRARLLPELLDGMAGGIDAESVGDHRHLVLTARRERDQQCRGIEPADHGL